MYTQLCVTNLIGLFTSNSAGFFWPSSPHRLPHDSKWPNPALFGALISGLIHTSVCYFTTVFPHILPQFQSGSQSQLVWEPDYYLCLACEVLGWLPMKIYSQVRGAGWGGGGGGRVEEGGRGGVRSGRRRGGGEKIRG